MPPNLACPLCCSITLPTERYPGPLTDLDSFLALGILPLQVNVEVLDNFCSHHHNDSVWYDVSEPKTLRSILRFDEVEAIVDMVNFLVKNHFIAITCRFVQPEYLPLRVYIIPYDLPNVKGQLRLREETVLATARQYMGVVLPHILSDPLLWAGNLDSLDDPRRHPLFEGSDNRTIAEIYGDLPSPKASSQYVHRRIPGIRTILYPYQVESVNCMLVREQEHRRIPDPLYVPLSGLDNKTFFFQPATLEVLSECPHVTEYSGGILCEELGTGKTVMILSLVLATLHQLPHPEESILDPRAVMTPLSFRHFPFSLHSTARKRLLRGSRSSRNQSGLSLRQSVPSLVELLLDYCRMHPRDTGLWLHEEDLEDRGLLESLRLNAPFYHHYDTTVVEPTRTSRTRSVNPGPKTMYLSPATLIIVPPNLLPQWVGEIHKHCEETLRMFIVNHDTDIPSAPELATKYDIILMSYQRFSAESLRRKYIASLSSWMICSCPEYQETRVPICNCSSSSNASPLLQVRWKRLVIDEGHVSGALDTNLTPFSQALSVECRWIVTGTPTTNLLGLKHGQGSDLQYQSDDGLFEPLEADSAEDSPGDETLATRCWSSDDRVDLRKFATMMMGFLGIPQFSQNARLFGTHVVIPLFKRPCPLPGAIQVLTQVMSSIMIRHRVEDVEHDVLLPSIVQEAIFLDLDSYARLSYNALQAAIAINAIDSERVGTDYLFHSKNTALLKTTVQNVSQAMFWHVDSEKMFNVDELISHADEYKSKARERKSSSSDIALLDEALEHVMLAYANRVWRNLQAHPFVFHRCYGLSAAVYQAWTPLWIKDQGQIDSLLHADRFLKLRDLTVKRPLASEDILITHGQTIREEEEERRKEEERRRFLRNKNIRDSTLKEIDAGRRAAAPEKISEMQQELQAAHEDMMVVHDQRSPSVIPTHSPRMSYVSRLPRTFPASSILSRVRIGNSTSSKLDYLLNEILSYSTSEKFLIFSSSALTLAFVAEGLELINTKYLQYTTHVKPKVREQLVRTFETSDLYRVFLMELKHGARGLNLVTASRVIFCEPVWHADVETQAIKRVHRIGQTRSVTVKTLAIRGTYEEVMMMRRDALKGSGIKQPQFTDDRRMRDFIANPTFLTGSSDTGARPTLDVPLIDCSSSSISGISDSASNVRSVDVVQSDNLASSSDVARLQDMESEPPRKKVRGVRFVDDS